MSGGNAQRFWLVGLHLAALILLAPPGRAAAADRMQLEHSVVRLLQGGTTGAEREAGIDITLGQGWKTYWRMPGESGVPPEFDWSGSTNVAGVKVSWPAPHRMHDAGGESVGYKNEVVFPLTVRLAAPDRPARLDLKLFFAVCKNICVPAKAEVSLDLGAEPPAAADVSLIRRFQARVPVEDASGTQLIAAHPVMSDGKPGLAVIVASQLGAGAGTDIFVEGYEDAYFHAPGPGRLTGRGREFVLPVDGIANAAVLSGKRLRITLVSADRTLFRELAVE